MTHGDRTMSGVEGPRALARAPAELPSVSVIVAVYNGQATLPDCLESLLRLDYPRELLEVVCVDNASSDATPRILAGYGARVRVLREARRGPAAARNHGVRHARGEVIALTDADCTVERDWLRHLVAPLGDPRIGVVGGRILSRRPCNFIEAFGERIHDHARALGEMTPPYAITMNWASRRTVLEDLGLFNDALLRSSDVDCSYRMTDAGYRLVYAPDAIVYHRNERTPWGLMHEGYVHGFHAPRVQRLHAEFLRRVRAARRADVREPVAQPTPHWTEAWLWSIFRLGKRLGRWHASWAAAPDRSDSMEAAAR